MEILKVIEGWRNHLLPPPSLKELIQHTHEERMEICRVCPDNSKNKGARHESCTLCGCPLKAKTKCLSCSCGAESWNQYKHNTKKPVRWGPVLTALEEEELTKTNNDEEATSHGDNKPS